MPSFRAKVLDALNIVKTSIKLPVEHVHLGQQFVVSKEKTFPSSVALTGDATHYGIGGNHYQTLDYVGFVVGQSQTANQQASYVNAATMLDGPSHLQKPYPTGSTYEGSGSNNNVDTGFHYLNGIYNENSEKLQAMRKSSLLPVTEDSMYVPSGTVAEHSHKDWPTTVLDQVQLLNENPYADALMYHQMKLSFLITGVQKPDSTYGAASNQRGIVRMLIIRPIVPSARLNFNGASNKPVIRTDYLPNFDTDLFYSGKQMLGGHLASTDDLADNSDISTTFGLDYRAPTQREINTDVDSMYYGKEVPKPVDENLKHSLSPFDIIGAPINRKKYKVITDRTFTLDTQHHGQNSIRREDVTIPFHMMAKFGGRVPELDPNDSTNPNTGNLTGNTYNEPMNMPSKPIILFLSMDQKLSIQCTGYTVISEV
jgi:hypothetical protein